MNEFNFLSREKAEQLKEVKFIEMARDNGIEYEWRIDAPLKEKPECLDPNISGIQTVEAYQTFSRNLMWDALPVIYFDHNTEKADIKEPISHNIKTSFLYKVFFKVMASNGILHTEALGDLWIFLLKHNLINQKYVRALQTS